MSNLLGTKEYFFRGGEGGSVLLQGLYDFRRQLLTVDREVLELHTQ